MFTGAWVGEHATVDAKGHGTAFLDLPDGAMNDGGTFGRESVRGVAVDAESSEKVFVIAASAAIGGYAGIAGGIAYEGLRSNTRATIGNGARINQTDNASADALQAVHVTAIDDADVFAFGGGLSTGIGSLAGGVNVGVIRANVSAAIGDADVQARGSVKVDALGNKEVETAVISGANGGAAIAGSVSVWTIDDALSSNYSAQQRDSDGKQQADKTDDALKGDETTPTRSFDTADIRDDLNEDHESELRRPDDTIHFSSAHGYVTGDKVVYHANGGHPIGGLSDGQTYYVVRVNDNDIRLAKTADDATQDATDADAHVLLDKSKATGGTHELGASSADSGAQNAEAQTGEFSSALDGYQDPNTGKKTDEGARQQSIAASSASSSLSASSPSGKTQSILHDSAKAGITASIGNGATVVAGDSVEVRAKERVEFTAFAGTESTGAAGIGAGISIVTLGSHVEASIGNASITAGSGFSDNISVEANLVTDFSGKAWAARRAA